MLAEDVGRLSLAHRGVRRADSRRRVLVDAREDALCATFATPDCTGAVEIGMAYLPASIAHLLPFPANAGPLSLAVPPLVRCRLARPAGVEGPARARVTSSVVGYSAPAVTTVHLPANGAAVEIGQTPTFFLEQVRRVRVTSRATVRVRVEILHRDHASVEVEQTFTLWLLPRDVAYLAKRDPVTGMDVPFTAWLGAFVTPTAPGVVKMLRRAVELHPEHTLRGYLTTDGDVTRQVEAIWGALRPLEIDYVDTAGSFGPTLFVQRVRLPSEVLRDRVANCVDGALLVASMLEGALLDPGLVLLGSHVVVGWQTKHDGPVDDFLEPTLLGSAAFDVARSAGRAVVAKARSAGPIEILSLEQLRSEQIFPLE
jgi:hypothetical protein